MAKCIVCGESYADQLRRCPYCGEAPERAPSFAPAPAPELARGAGPSRRPHLILALAAAGICALVAAIAMPLWLPGASDEEAQAGKKSVPSQVEQPRTEIKPKAEQQGFAVTEVRWVEERLFVTGTCQPDETVRILVNDTPAVIEPAGNAWHAFRATDELDVVAVGISGDRKVEHPPAPPPPAASTGGRWRLHSHADGATVHTGELRVVLTERDPAARAWDVEVKTPRIVNVVDVEGETFLLYRAPPDLVYLRTTPEGTYTFLRKFDNQEMVLVPAGIAYRGEGDGPPNGPRHLIRTRAYLIDRTEITGRQYAAFLRHVARANSTNLRHPEDDGVPLRPLHWTSDEPPEGMADHPVRGVSWYAAAAYAKWVGGSLPTEAQWERAATGALGAPYPWGATLDPRRCRVQGDGTVRADSMPRGASPYGLLHMSGNVREWCEDRFDPRWYERVSFVDPRGPIGPRHRVVRGGSFRSAPETQRGQYREHLVPKTAAEDIGFRVVWRWPDFGNG